VTVVRLTFKACCGSTQIDSSRRDGEGSEQEVDVGNG
jgi:hypothetical protein